MTSNGALTADQIRNVKDLKREKVNVPEWGGFLWVRVMSGTDRDSYEQLLANPRTAELRDKIPDLRAEFCWRVICNDDNELLFNVKDVRMLGNKSHEALDRVFVQGKVLNKFEDEQVEELMGN